MGQPEEVPDAVALSKLSNKDGVVLPNSFTIRPQNDSKTKFNIRGDSGSSYLTLAYEYNSSKGSIDWDAEESTLFLISAQGQRLATIKHYRGYANATLHDSGEFRISYSVQGDHKAVHAFSIPQIGHFEWRKGDSGWELVQPAEPNLVLATGVLNVGSDKPPRFAMTEIGSRANFGENWNLVAIVSYLRVWDRMRLAFGNPQR
ncbi:hypothetical protein FALBO_4771 [Fusarium albosuccineum]|uniref:Uncharacterized protein n=1 Tax=Fusarium albosuccineum TaxID=1237068 RepID=A0A8H4LI40_9HYPO|nr:hypothetical protein FALBO_4771 [Fusarium albosuccineum]